MKLVALTGAGISKASGVPTFDELGDIRDKLSREYFNEHPQEFYDILLKMKDIITSSKPNRAHLALAEYKIPIVTMNVDGLHRAAGSKEIIEIHGNLDYVSCKGCKEDYPFEILRKSIYCGGCNQLLEPNVVLYGDEIPQYFDAINLIDSSNRLLVVGTSFYTSTVNDLVFMAETAGIKVDIINAEAEIEVEKYLKEVLKHQESFSE
ncbi:NAD-dependent deacetylase [Natronincola peptidivorans]|uniref:protein acetyllysine N-acetyltransferase n=1 Tax=Natronincola peptidivorans TaxID=426128 RepID=A0A1I0FLU4_9FIRM|nr:Sir2 family NAD-dependent protein deacetylase [Natronincola peptidivorans]SET59270.1 NAD-dependent deacetylase [Natronincola peptidivorans]